MCDHLKSLIKGTIMFNIHLIAGDLQQFFSCVILFTALIDFQFHTEEPAALTEKDRSRFVVIRVNQFLAVAVIAAFTVRKSISSIDCIATLDNPAAFGTVGVAAIIARIA